MLARPVLPDVAASLRLLRRLFARAPHQGGDLRLRPVARDVFVYRGYFSNSAVLLLPRSVLVVDTQVTPRAAQPLLAQLRALTDRPVRFVFNTHHHGDHVGGNAAFAGAQIISSADTARFVVERADERLHYARTFGLEIDDVPPPHPAGRTFDQRLELTIDGEHLELFRCGQVETPDAAVLWWPARRVLAAGDGVATAGYPYLGVPFLDEGLKDDGQWIGYLARLRALAPRGAAARARPGPGGRAPIAARLDLLAALMRDLFVATRAELASPAAAAPCRSWWRASTAGSPAMATAPTWNSRWPPSASRSTAPSTAASPIARAAAGGTTCARARSRWLPPRRPTPSWPNSARAPARRRSTIRPRPTCCAWPGGAAATWPSPSSGAGSRSTRALPRAMPFTAS